MYSINFVYEYLIGLPCNICINFFHQLLSGLDFQIFESDWVDCTCSSSPDFQSESQECAAMKNCGNFSSSWSLPKPTLNLNIQHRVKQNLYLFMCKIYIKCTCMPYLNWMALITIQCNYCFQSNIIEKEIIFFLALVSLYQEKKYPRPVALRNTYSGPPFENFFQCALISLPLLLDMVCFLQLCQVLQSQLIKLLTAWFPSFIFADSVYSAWHTTPKGS